MFKLSVTHSYIQNDGMFNFNLIIVVPLKHVRGI